MASRGRGRVLLTDDQLGSGWSDVPVDESLWELDRFVDEVEQVRAALGLERDSFVLLGHSWGGILAAEYALAHGEHLKGLVISNMMMDVQAYNRVRPRCPDAGDGPNKRWPRSRRSRPPATTRPRGSWNC